MELTIEVPKDPAAAVFAKQLGISRITGRAAPNDDQVVTREQAEGCAAFYRSHGLSWEVSRLPYPYYWKAMHGVEGRDEQIDKYIQSLRSLAGVGVKVVGFVWALLGYLRSEHTPTGRGGVVYPRWDRAVAERLGASAFDWWGRFSDEYPRIPHRPIGAEEVWENMGYFLERVLPVAEELGIRLAVHPDDPPVPEFMGVARILSSPDDLKRFIELGNSESLGLLFCIGTVATMAGVDAVEQIRRFGGQGKIFYVHLRNPRGSGDFFEEVLSDEGDVDLRAALEALDAAGYEGLVQIDHAPAMIGKDGARRSYAYQLGYARGLAAAAGLATGGDRDAIKG